LRNLHLRWLLWWLLLGCALDLLGGVDKIGNVVMRNCLGPIRSRERRKPTVDFIDGIIVILILRHELLPHLIQRNAYFIFIQHALSLNVCSAT
jgi:hypothetical protein